MYPWEAPTERTLEDTVKALQADMRFAVKYTSVLVRSPNILLRMVINTERGQEIPKGLVTFTDGSTVEMQDLGMPQVGVPVMTVYDLTKLVLHKAFELRLELI